MSGTGTRGERLDCRCIELGLLIQDFNETSPKIITISSRELQRERNSIVDTLGLCNLTRNKTCKHEFISAGGRSESSKFVRQLLRNCNNK